MKLLHGLLACFVALPLALALDDQASAVLSTLPKCAAKCLVTNVLQSTCDLEDVKCTCQNEALQKQVEICVLKSCTVKEGLSTKNTTLTLCGAPVRNKTTAFVTLNDIMGAISGAFCLMRYVTKFAYNLPYGMDDVFMLLTMLNSIACIVINSYGLASTGLGKDIWTREPTQITDFARWFYTMAILYFSVQTFLKLSMIFFYLRIFPSTRVRRALWTTVAFTVANGITFVIVAIFQCQPISYFWTKWDHEHTGKCASVNSITWSNAAVNIALDFWILGIPLSQLKKMNLDWRKKVGVGMMFSVGVFVTIMSILRLYACIEAGLSHTNNATWEYLPMSKWSTIEINVGIWCACMPALRVLLVRLFPKLLGTSKRYLNYGSTKSYKTSNIDGTNTNGHRSHSRSEPLGSSAQVGKSPHQHTRVDPVGITCDRTYEVQYGDDDETYLVHMKQLDNKSANSLTRSDRDSV